MNGVKYLDSCIQQTYEWLILVVHLFVGSIYRLSHVDLYVCFGHTAGGFRLPAPYAMYGCYPTRHTDRHTLVML